MKNTKKLVFISLLIALSLSISLLESMLPLPFIVPGAKLGLSNIVILVTLVLFGFNEAFLVSTLKSLLLMFITGSMSSFIYSFSGAVLSTVTMWFALRFLSKFLSLIGVSIIGAVSHNFTQVSVASLILNNILLYSYLPILVFVGLFTGFFVGISSTLISEKLNRVYKFSEEKNEEFYYKRNR